MVLRMMGWSRSEPGSQRQKRDEEGHFAEKSDKFISQLAKKIGRGKRGGNRVNLVHSDKIELTKVHLLVTNMLSNSPKKLAKVQGGFIKCLSCER